MPRKLGDSEKNLLILFHTHFKDAIIALKTDLKSRKDPKITTKPLQDGFSFNNMWDGTFVADRLKTTISQQAAVKNQPTVATPAPSATTNNDKKTTDEKPSISDAIASFIMSKTTTPTAVQASSSSTETTPEGRLADLTVEDVCADELICLASGEAKIDLTEKAFKEDWTNLIQDTGTFADLGKDFIQGLQLHLKERNQNTGITDLKLNLDYADGPVPRFYYFLAKLIAAACNSSATMPLRSHYLLLLVRYTIKNVIAEPKRLLSGWNSEKSDSRKLKKMLGKLDKEHLSHMDNHIREKLADAHAPELFSALREKDKAIRSKLIKLLFTLFYQEDNQRSKSKEVLESAWEEYQKQCKEAQENEEEPPKINLIFLMAIMQIQISKSPLKTNDKKNDNVMPDISSSSGTDDDNYSTDNDDDDDDNDDDTNAFTMETIDIQKGKKIIPLQMNPKNAVEAPKLTAEEQNEISALMPELFALRNNNVSMDISNKELTPQQVVDWGLVDPKSNYFKNETTLKMKVLPNKDDRERKYCALLDAESGVPNFLIDNEIKILKAIREGDKADQEDLVIAKWLLLWSYYYYYCLNSDQILLGDHAGKGAGELGLFLIMGGPTRAGFQLNEESISRLSTALESLEQSIDSFVRKTVDEEQDIPEKWNAHYNASRKTFREVINELADEQAILADLQVIAEQWRINEKDKTEKLKQIFDAYGETINRNAFVASKEFLSEEMGAQIQNLARTDRHMRARKIDEFSQQMSATPEPMSTSDKNKVLNHGVSGARPGVTKDFNPGPVLDRTNLTLQEREQALNNEQARARAREEIDLEIQKLEALKKDLSKKICQSNSTHSTTATGSPAMARGYRQTKSDGASSVASSKPSQSTDASNKKRKKKSRNFVF